MYRYADVYMIYRYTCCIQMHTHTLYAPYTHRHVPCAGSGYSLTGAGMH
jgi:hypothetical protein